MLAGRPPPKKASGVLTALCVKQRMRGVLDVNGVGLPTLVYPLRDGGRHQRAHAGHGRSQPVDHVAPVRHHIERDTAALGAFVVPARALAFLRRAVEDPGPGIDLDREKTAEEAGILHEQQFCEPGQEQLVLDDAVFHAGLVRQARQLHRFVDGGRCRLFDMDVFAGGDCLAHTGGTITGCGAIHENVVRPGQSLGQVRRPAQAAVRCGECRQPVSIPADEHQLGHQPVAVA